MKGIIRNATAFVGLALALAPAGCTHTCGGGGADCCGAGHGHGHGLCHEDWDLYDRCYPQRYWYQARSEVDGAFAPQVQNGHILDQTVWNHHFDPGTDKLTAGGLEHLAYLVRRRPCPDTTLYLQTANDLTYDPACPDHLAGAKQELDCRRVQAIQKLLAAQTAGRPVDFQVLIHDPSDPTIAAIPASLATSQMYLRFRGGLGIGGGGAGGGAGAAAAGPR
jgi:hypothetical protein